MKRGQTSESEICDVREVGVGLSESCVREAERRELLGRGLLCRGLESPSLGKEILMTLLIHPARVIQMITTMIIKVHLIILKMRTSQGESKMRKRTILRKKMVKLIIPPHPEELMNQEKKMLCSMFP
nr:hypothetical protein Iba_chr10dCG11110 [Ipomoea batatas]